MTGFLDAGHHGALCGRPSRNLDTWLMTPETNRSIFAQGCREAEAAVVEGVMGLFDGVDGASEAALEGDCILGPAGARVRGHSSHYSCALPGADSARSADQTTYRLGGQQTREGFRTENILASNIHLCFRSTPESARAFLRSASMGAQ